MTATAEILSRPKKPIEPRRVLLEAYFLAEEKSFHKHEFHDGTIIKMPGGTFNHDNLASKMIQFLGDFVEKNDLDYFVNGSNTKIRIEDFNKVVYPDALVISGKPQYFEDRKDTITNPIVIVEVLSKSTSKYDRTDKFDAYRSLESFKEYVLIFQKKKQVWVYSKQGDGSWILREYVGDESMAVLYAIQNCPVSLRRLYKGLEL